MTDLPPAPLALHLDSDALKANWLWLAGKSGAAACGAAIKANAYGLGAVAVLKHLKAAGCRDFFVATWAEAAELMPHLEGAALSVLHGVREEDMALALGSPARPVLNSPAQIARWKAAGGGACDVMLDTGMNRLGLDANDVKADLFEGLEVETCMSHLACADEPDHQLNLVQPMILRQLSRRVGARRLSLANSAGILAGEAFAFDLTRPGISLYGGIQHPDGTGHIRQVVTPRAQILQRRVVRGGESVGYGATYVADRQREAAVINIGYADGYYRCFSGMGAAKIGDLLLPVMGRVSMDLVTIDVDGAPELREGDWVDMDFDLPMNAAFSGMSQYELLTGLGRRFDRIWS
ncbi:MAG TPA: alanine racemase [Sphingobium sp.]|nr:alanine racemase [Sphingobium sp.]